MTPVYPSERARRYRQQARRCLDQSRRVVTKEARAILFDLADHWTRLAEQIEQRDAWPVSRMPDATVVIVRPKGQ